MQLLDSKSMYCTCTPVIFLSRAGQQMQAARLQALECKVAMAQQQEHVMHLHFSKSPRSRQVSKGGPPRCRRQPGMLTVRMLVTHKSTDNRSNCPAILLGSHDSTLRHQASLADACLEWFSRSH